MSDEPEKFDWLRDDSIVVHHQPALAIYQNAAESVIIRQEANWDEEQDSYVYIASVNLRTVIDALSAFLPAGQPKRITHQRGVTPQANMLAKVRQ